MNYSPLLITNTCLYLVLHFHCYQKKLECSGSATNNMLIRVSREIWKIWKETVATCTDKFSSHEIGPVRVSPCRGLHSTESFLMCKHLGLDHKCQLPWLWLHSRPLAPKGDAQNLHVIGNLNSLTTALTCIYYIKKKPHFSFVRLYPEKSSCKWHLVGVVSLVYLLLG